MNVHTAPAGHQHHPPHPVTAPTGTTPEMHRVVRRVGVLDRAAMHLGMALIRWGRRPPKAARPSRARPNRAVFNAEELEARRARDHVDQYLAMKMTQFR